MIMINYQITDAQVSVTYRKKIWVHRPWIR